jgi:isoleucyl-tRNA synthetase
MYVTYDVGGKEGANELEAACDGPVLIILNTKADQQMLDEGIAREVINRIQKLKKKAHLVPTDKVIIYLQADKSLDKITVDFADYIENAVRSSVKFLKDSPKGSQFLIQEDFLVKDSKLVVAIFKEETADEIAQRLSSTPFCQYVNLVVNETLKSRASGFKGTILLENPVGKRKIKLAELKDNAQSLFGLFNSSFRLCNESGKNVTEADCLNLHGKTVYVCKTEDLSPKCVEVNGSPFVRFKNVEQNGSKVTLLLENPLGEQVFNGEQDASKFANQIL